MPVRNSGRDANNKVQSQGGSQIGSALQFRPQHVGVKPFPISPALRFARGWGLFGFPIREWLGLLECCDSRAAGVVRPSRFASCQSLATCQLRR